MSNIQIMRKFIGWDCANKTLAWSYIDIDTEILVKLATQTRAIKSCLDDYKSRAEGHGEDHYEAFMGQIRAILKVMFDITDGFIRYRSHGVVDILGGEKLADVSPVERTQALWRFLSTHPVIAHIDPDTVSIIEYQPQKIGAKTNMASSMVSHQLMFYYVNNGPILVDPKLKNTISCGPGMTYEYYLADEMPRHKTAQAARYAARKRHSKENFIYMLDTLGMQHIIRGVRKSVLDDLADSTMQIIAYLVANKLIKRP